jgi:hypothetical protein
MLTLSQGLYSLSQLGVDHRDVSIGNVLLGTDPEKAAGFISDLDLSSISEEAIKAACPNDYDTIISQMKTGEWRTVCDYHLEATWTNLSYDSYAQGTALFMSSSLLAALMSMGRPRNRSIKSDFTFQHRLCHDFESLIWVIVYAMMIHHRNYLATTDPEMCELYRKDMDECWAGHAHSNLYRSHSFMISIGCSIDTQSVVSSSFPDPREAAFFRDAMRLVRSQHDGEPITYEGLCTLFKKHVQLAKEPRASDVVSK